MPQEPTAAPISTPSIASVYAGGSDGAAPCVSVLPSASSSSTEPSIPSDRASIVLTSSSSTSRSGAPVVMRSSTRLCDSARSRCAVASARAASSSRSRSHQVSDTITCFTWV